MGTDDVPRLPPGAEPGRPAGPLRGGHGEFADLLRTAAYTALGQADVTDAWWAERGATRTEVMSRWGFGVRGDFEAVLGLEFPAVAGAWLAEHSGACGLSYGYVLFDVTKE